MRPLRRTPSLLLALALLWPTAASAQEEDAVEAATVTTRSRPVDGALEGRAQRVERISSRDLERRGATDLGQALEWLSAGASTSPTGTARGLIVDGLPTSQLVVLRDGLPVSRPSGSPQGPIVDLSSIAIDPSNIERIDIYRGAGPPGSGVNAGVVIDIVSRRPRQHARGSVMSRLTASPDGLARQDYDLSATQPLGESFEAGLSGQYTTAEAINADLNDAPDTPARDRLGGEASLTWRPERNAHLRLRLLGWRNETTALGGASAVFDDRVVRDNLRARMQGRWWLGRDLRLDHGTEVARARYDFDKIVRRSGFERDKSLTTHDEVTQTAALTWFTRSHDLTFEAMGAGRRIERTGETGELPRVSMMDLSAAVSDTWYASERVEVFTRGLAAHSTAFGPGVDGQLGASLGLGEQWTLRPELSQTRRLPTPEELFLDFDHSEVGYQLTGNEELRPERLRSASLGLVWVSKQKRLGLEARGFYHRLRDTIATAATPEDPALFTYENRGRAHTAGAQAIVQLRELPGGLSLLGNYTYLPVATDLELDERLPLRAAHAGRVELRGEWLGGKLAAWSDLDARSQMPVPEGSPESPARALTGVGVAYRPWRATSLVLDLNNLLDHRDPTWGPALGRSAFVSLRVGYDAASGR